MLYINVYYMKAKVSVRKGKYFIKIPIKTYPCFTDKMAKAQFETIKKYSGFRPFLTTRSEQNIDNNGFFAYIEKEPVKNSKDTIKSINHF